MPYGANSIESVIYALTANGLIAWVKGYSPYYPGFSIQT